MYNQIRMPLACFVLLLFTLICYAVKKRLRTMNAKVFESMACFGLIHVLASIVTEYTVNNRSAVSPMFNEIWHIIFLVSCSFMCALLYLYLILYVERGTGRLMKGTKLALSLVTAASILGELILPITYIDTEFGSYSLGCKAYSLYMVVIYCMVMMVVTIIRYHRFIPFDRCILLLTSVAAFTVISLIQIAFPYILLTGFATTLIVMGIMFNTEDVHMYISGGDNYYNEQGCREILSEAVLAEHSFQVAVYIFVGRDSAVEAGMRSLWPKLEKDKNRLICGSVADNCMLVIPMRKKNAVYPLPSLPAPDCEDGAASYFLEVLNLEAGESVDSILCKARDIKNRYEESVLQRDDLTGLLRRTPFVRQVEAMLEAQQEFTLLMIDLDNFKQVNDRFGHGIGDAVLRQFANILREELQPADLLCRIGGDEFSIVLMGQTSREKVCGIVERLQKRITSLEVGITVSISVGARVNSGRDKAGSFQQMYAESDAALYQSKYRGKCCLTFSDN